MSIRRRLAPLVLLAALLADVSPAAAQIDLFDWTLKGASSGSGTQTADTLVVTGPDGLCEIPITYFEAMAELDGTLRVMLDFQNLDSGVAQGHPDYDAPAYYLNGAIVQATQEPVFGGWPTGEYDLKIKLKAGDVFGLGVWSIDCIEGPGIATYHDLTFTPKAWSSQPVGLDPRVRFTLPGSASDVPVAAAAAGDVDADGVPDFITGFAGGASGKAVVRSGATGAKLLTFTGPADFGSALAGAGDVDADGHDDLIVGAGADSTLFPGGGSAWVYSGDGGGLLYSYQGGALFDGLGTTVAGVGDVDADGFDDFAIRVRKISTAPSDVRVHSGATGAVLHTITAPAPNQRFGERLARVGDVDADGHDDVGVGGVSTASVFSGDTGNLLLSLGDNLGEHVTLAAAGDVDGDDHDDVVVGAPEYAPGPVIGRVIVRSGQTGGVLLTLDGVEPDGRFGAEVTGGADLDGDGRLDVGVSSPDAGAGGVVEVFDALDGSLRSTLLSIGPGDGLGERLERMGDVDGDGQDDLVVLAPSGGPTQAGYVRVFQRLDALGAPLLTGAGSLEPGAPLAIELNGGLPNQASWFVLGTQYLGVPFLGGTLGPSPDVLRLFFTDAEGAIAIQGVWPLDIPVGTSVWVQAWVTDPSAPLGYAASNALAATQL